MFTPFQIWLKDFIALMRWFLRHIHNWVYPKASWKYFIRNHTSADMESVVWISNPKGHGLTSTSIFCSFGLGCLILNTTQSQTVFNVSASMLALQPSHAACVFF